jgi:hypothetical protein
MATDPQKESSIRPLVVALLGGAGAIVFAIVIPAWLVRSYADITWQLYRADLLKGSLTIATGLVLTVVVAMLVENHRQRAARRSADRDLRRALVAQLRRVHDEVKAAALLIEAHQSARTYGEQMRRLIEVRVRLLDARRTVVAETKSFGKDANHVVTLIETGADYLSALTDEYKKQYLRVSRIQLYSHEWDLAQAKVAAQRPEPPVPSDMKSSTVPWAELTGPAFARLKILREADEESSAAHESEFSRPLGRAIDLLRKQNSEYL